MIENNAKHQVLCLIDDSPEDREVFRRYLLEDTAYNYQIIEVETGEQGIELCQTLQPDCILLDYNLPDQDGLEVLSALADASGTVPHAVIMLTGLGSEAIALQAMQRGAQDYLVKGEMTAGNLFRAIHNAIERTSMLRTMEQQREDLERKNQEMQAFAYALAHDLRAPLRAISGFAQILAHDYRPVLDESGQRYIDRIVSSSAQMDRLIDELLSYTRIENRSVRRKPVALAYMVAQVIEELAELVTKTSATISVGENLPTIASDPVLLHQIIVNLLSNALIYHKPDLAPRVEIRYTVQRQECLLAISDNGIGIASRHHEKIFTIFQRLNSEDEYSGTGIGLALVKKAVELIGGSIWVESVLSQGSTFYVKLPLY